MRPFFKKVMTTLAAGLLLPDPDTESENRAHIAGGENDYYDMYMMSRGMYPDHDVCDMYCRYLYR